MVSTYLVHHGYCATAEAFAKSTSQKFEEDLNSIKNRQSKLKLSVFSTKETFYDLYYVLSLERRGIYSYMRRFTSTLKAWYKIVLFSAHVQINLEKLITSS